MSLIYQQQISSLFHQPVHHVVHFQDSAQKFLSGGLKITQTDMLCTILGYIAHVSVI